MFLAASLSRATVFAPPKKTSVAFWAPEASTALNSASTMAAASSSESRASHSVSSASVNRAFSVRLSR